MIDKLLVPVDGSELSEKVLVHVRSLLHGRDAELVLVTVVSSLEAAGATTNPLAIARSYLEEIKGRLEGEGARVSLRVLVGDPATRLLEAALAVTPDLICMSTHGRTGVTRLIRGSVAERVLRSSPFPVLVANPSGLPGVAAKARFAKVLVPLDGSDLSAAVLPLAARIAAIHESELVLYSSCAPSGEAEARRTLEAYRASLDLQRVRILTTDGPPAAAILEVIDREKPDLVAMTTHGRAGLSRWVYGSVAESVLRQCGAPLLLKRTSSEAG